MLLLYLECTLNILNIAENEKVESFIEGCASGHRAQEAYNVNG